MNGSTPTPGDLAYPPFLGEDGMTVDPAAAAAAIIPVPYDQTSTWRKGADRGPAALLDASGTIELYDIQTNSEPWKRGIVTLPPILHDGGPEELAELVRARAAEVLANGSLPVVIGGEHSVTIGAVEAAAETFPGVGVLQIDAHGDTRESYEGSSHNHACVMARARERCPIVQVGIRAVDASEMLETAFRRVQSCPCRTVPVLQRGKLVGLVTMENVGEFVAIQAAEKDFAAARTRQP